MGKNIEWAELEALMDEFEFKTIEEIRICMHALMRVIEYYEYLKGKVEKDELDSLC